MTANSSTYLPYAPVPLIGLALTALIRLGSRLPIGESAHQQGNPSMKAALTALAALLSIQFAVSFLNGAGKVPEAVTPPNGQERVQTLANKLTPTIGPPPGIMDRAPAAVLEERRQAGKLPPPGHQVLFIGNSLTSTND